MKTNMAPMQERSDASVKFVFLTKKLLSATSGRIGDKAIINSYLGELNELDYRTSIVSDSDAALLLVNQLCTGVQPSETLLVKNTGQLLVNLVRSGEKFQGRTFTVCVRWLLEALEFSEHAAWNNVLFALQSLLGTGPFDSVNQHLRNLVGDGGILRKFVPPSSTQWSERNFLAMCCLEAILLNRENSGAKVSPELLVIIKNIALNTIATTTYEDQDKHCYNKVAGSCLRVLRSIVSDKSFVKTADVIGEILGVVQAFMFHGIKGYQPLKVQQLRPAAMNLPEATHTIPRGRNLRNHKAKSRRQQSKKTTSEVLNSSLPETVGSNKYPSDSDTSDTEAINPGKVESIVRHEAVKLLNSIVQSTPSREIFGYWPQIVASGSRGDARVLTRCVLREPVSKVRQSALSTLTELLIGGRTFLIHAEDAERSSFVTFFGTVSAMIRELHSSLSLLLSTERNVAVLTHALKCAATLAQGTPYARLKPGLANKLIRNCRPQIFHKDPTVRVAALSVFEALVSSDPITPEILNILAKQTTAATDSELSYLNVSATSDIGTEEEVEFEDIEEDEVEIDYCQVDSCQEKEISSLLHACLKNVSTETVSVPVRLASLKLIGALAFNTGSLVLCHLEVVATSLVAATREPEIPITLHAGRVIETIAGCLTNSPINDSDALAFWNIVFDPVASLAQQSHTTLREVACDCVGNIGSNVFSQLPRERCIIIITTLFGAARDEESAVRAAALRALGMLVLLPSLEDDVGFLMDLADTVCLALDDHNLGVRVKAAWTLANLCDCLVRQEGNQEVEPISLDTLLPRLFQASVTAAKDNDKVKCNAVRAVGSSLYLCPDRQILKDTAQGLETLLNCATTGNDMKVRWNACRALGFVLSHNPDHILPSLWRDQVFPELCRLVCHSPNFKVRTNAAWALSVCQSYGKHVLSLWKTIVLALDNSQHVPSYVEYGHRDALVQQLCLTLSHLAVYTKATELPALWEEIGDHMEDTAAHMKQFQERVLPEKAGDLVNAKVQMTKYAQTALTSKERQIASALAKLFERTDSYDNLDMMSILS